MKASKWSGDGLLKKISEHTWQPGFFIILFPTNSFLKTFPECIGYNSSHLQKLELVQWVSVPTIDWTVPSL